VHRLVIQRQIWDFAPRRAAERMLLDDDDNRSAVDDLRQARELAMLISLAKKQSRRSSRTARLQRVIC
jgi:hypothetical protein